MIDFFFDLAQRIADAIHERRPAILEARVSKLWNRIKRLNGKPRSKARLRRIRRLTVRVEALEGELVELKRLRGLA